MAEFTKGEWFYDFLDNDVYVSEETGRYVNVATVKLTGERIENEQGNYDYPETTANGFLIAAAPLLYEALAAAWTALVFMEDKGEFEEGIVGAAETALAAARGEFQAELPI